jgi:hypothetical protein
MTITDSLRVALSELAAIRASCVTLNETMLKAKARFQEEHVELANAINDHAVRLAEAEAQVRSLTLAAYDMSGEKKPAPGADVVIRTTYIYDESAAMVWAETALPTAITRKLDVKTLDKIASTGALPFATKLETPSVRIASDLSDYLAIPEPSHV